VSIRPVRVARSRSDYCSTRSAHLEPVTSHRTLTPCATIPIFIYTGNMRRFRPFTISYAASALLFASWPIHATPQSPYGLTSRPQSKPGLLMPSLPNGAIPKLLSQTGAFKDVRTLTASESLIPYDLNVPFWSDGATKSRWISVPNQNGYSGRIKFSPTGEWQFPAGTVFVKHFELPVDDTRADVHRRLETRLLVLDSTGGVYGVTYKWRPDNSDAELLTTNLLETIPIHTASGNRTQQWYYPSREDCRTCHTRLAGGVLGVKTRQLSRDLAYPSGVTDNELRAWNHIGLFDPQLDDADLPTYPKLAKSEDTSRPLEDRARSYLDANCSNCHRPNGTVASFDARYDTPLPEQNLIKGSVLIDEGIDNASIISPNDIWRSIALVRMRTLEGFKMPPVAHQVSDRKGIELIERWVQSVPGRQVLAPPSISPSGGNYAKPIEVTLNQEQGATIHYTIDGSAPTSSDPVYDKPIKLTGPTVLRARAYKPTYTKSITVQQTFIIGE
jgi:uncharacterized repeat protein (TIGR03806 family)